MTNEKTTPSGLVGQSPTEEQKARIRCGWPLCPYYDPQQKLFCPMPIQGSPCQGMGNPYEHYYGINKPID